MSPPPIIRTTAEVKAKLNLLEVCVGVFVG